MKHFAAAAVAAIILSTGAFAQNAAQKYTISGYMKDSLTTESLIGATAYSKSGLAGTSTNQYGFYSLTLPAGSVEIVYSYVGYGTQSRSFTLRGDTVLDVNLTGSVHLQEVTVTASRTDRIQERTQMSVINVPVAQIKTLPAFLGETDVLKSLQLMPGIQSGGEGTSGLYVRGGGPDQNLILLDGVPVYNASHLFGFFSVFNADAINNVELLKGGFPARYGGRISSVIDISMKEGNMQKFHGEGAMGLVASRVTLEGPIWKDHTSFIVSGRRTYVDLLMKPFIAAGNRMAGNNYKTDLGYYFYDLTAKINHRFSAKDRIYLSAYMGDDKFYMEDEYKWEGNGSTLNHNSQFEAGLKWGNITAAFRWNHVFSPKLFSNTTVTYSRYRFIISSEEKDQYTEWSEGEQKPVEGSSYFAHIYDSGINDMTYKIAFDYLPAPAHYIRFGAAAIYHTFTPGAVAFTSDTLQIKLGSKNIYSYEYSAYAEDDIRLTARLKVNAGLHWSAFSVRGNTYSTWQPRISARYLLTDRLSVKAAYSRMTQYIHLLTNSNIGLPTDLWVPSTDNLRPQTSDQVALGMAQNFREKYELSLEAYYKTMNNVLEYREGSGFFDNEANWEDKVMQGNGRSYGVELFAQKKTGSFTGWVGYTLSWTDRQFNELNEGKRFPYKYDRRHDLSIALMKRFGERIEVSGTWVYGTGNAVTLPIRIVNLNKPFNNRWGIYTDYGERNSYRMAPYHRLDLSISLIRKRDWGETRWVFGVYNAYSRKNPFFIDVRSGFTGYEYVQYSLFPIIPSISYQFKF